MEDIYEIKISSDRIALFVWLDSKNVNGRFSENGFLQYTPDKKIQFYADSNTTAEEVLESLSITNLLDDKFIE